MRKASQDDLDTSLFEAVNLGQVNDVRALIKAGSNVHQADEFGNYAVIIAASRNDLAMFKVLVSEGASVSVYNRSGEQAITWAERHNNQDMIDCIRSLKQRRTP